ncbi:cupin domain-containing protein [Asticcacaulis sp. DXS10W]|uniref:Cupin domain-containing protein n=1 Tax=Asticcacaulis currens TaxID=2984210 RepID=A0ABT5IE72_9CAUL|nr:cupin domain-containing protein [Asticcacaulis currens]MDC7694272.1 cupin domain-containing protein [Asticcacaulis currens]
MVSLDQLQSRLSDLSIGVHALTRPEESPASRLVKLDPNTVLNLRNGRHDVIILLGSLASGPVMLSPQSYIGLDGKGKLRAGPWGAVLFHMVSPIVPGGPKSIIKAENLSWFDGLQSGVRRCNFRTQDYSVALVDFTSGTRIRPHRHDRGEEIYLLAGELAGAPKRLKPGDWLRLNPSIVHAPHSETSTRFLVITGHLKPDGVQTA